MPRDRKDQSAADRLIVALDVDSIDHAVGLVDALAGQVTRFKIGSQLFTSAGPSAVEAVRKRGGEVFLDLKFHDIPNTVEGAAREAVKLGVFMFNVHASGGSAMMSAAARGAAEAAKALGVPRPLVIAVSVLTSLDRAALGSELRVASSIEGHVLHLCGLARGAGLDGSVASPNEIRAIRNAMGPAWAIVTPGVRPAGSDKNDQSRVATPRSAFQAGADYLVVGRPITGAPDPAAAAAALLAEMGRMTQTTEHAVLVQRLFEIGTIRFGEFTLKSGIKSPFYIDLRVVICYPDVLRRIGVLMAAEVSRCAGDRIAGIPYAGLPLAVSASLAGNLPLIYPRKEEKSYGTKRRIEGVFAPGDRVVLIDDIITDGGSKFEAIEVLEEAGLVIKDLVILIDREQGGRELLASKGYALHTILTISQCFDEWERTGAVGADSIAQSREFIKASRFG